MARNIQLIKEVIAELSKGTKVRAAAEKFNVPPSLIYSMCNCVGFSIRKLHARQKTTTQKKSKRTPRVYKPSERDLDIAAMRRSGFMLAAIGNKYDISRERVRQIIVKYNQNNPDNPVSNDIPRAARHTSPRIIERREVVAKMRRSGLSQIEIGKQLNISPAVVKQDIDHYNETAEDPVKHFVVVRRKLSLEDQEKIVDACKKGVFSRVLAEQFGVSVGRICHLSRRAGIPDRRHRLRSAISETNINREAISKEYAAGKSIKEIAREHGISVSAVRVICFRAGVHRKKVAKKKKVKVLAKRRKAKIKKAKKKCK